MAEFTVNSALCGYVHKVRGYKEGKKIIVDIDTPCAKIQKIAHMEVPMMEIFDIKNNYVIDRAREADCSSNCLVPCAILNLCRLECGFIAKSLAKDAGSISIDFDEV